RPALDDRAARRLGSRPWRSARGTRWYSRVGAPTGTLNMPSGGAAALPRGSAVNSELGWLGNSWRPVSPTDEVYTAITRAATFAALRSALGALARGGGRWAHGNGTYAAQAGYTWLRTNSGGDNLFYDLWPLGQPAPHVWIVAPSRWRWIDNYSADFWLKEVSAVAQAALAVEHDHFTIDGVSYDSARVQLAGITRAQSAADGINYQHAFRFHYDPPAAAGMISLLGS
ncbi:MAG: hypothetical protein OXH14_03240, partial [Alphaproteobacteria bacterium]|nr:hypothetical protein [Alphaproteobacteria bacterium]